MRHARAAADNAANDLFAVAREFHAHGYLVFAAEAAAGAVKLFRAERDPQALAASTLLADVLARCDTISTPALLTVQPSLTSRERQVAELAADGAKSREIADRLFLSPRTVENHLQRVYAKLGVNGRAQLRPGAAEPAAIGWQPMGDSVNDFAPALLTDQYELTMISAALKDGTADRRCVFEVFARRLPTGRRYGVVAGQGRLIELIKELPLRAAGPRFPAQSRDRRRDHRGLARGLPLQRRHRRVRRG